jgi:hypothetical protein
MSMDAEQELRKTIARYDRAHHKASSEIAALDACRNDAIRDAAASGLTRRKIAEIVGLSFQRVQQIVRGGR